MLLGWAQSLVVAQKPSKEIAEAITRSGLPVLDLVGAGLQALRLSGSA
jgi:hypothetical protein